MTLKPKPARLTVPGIAVLLVLGVAGAYLLSPLLGQVVLGVACALLLVRLERAHRKTALLMHRITQHRKSEALLRLQATHDSLTGLANRLLLTDRFESTVERCKRNKKPFALVMIDLNGFKAINDRFGHDAGDQVLVTVAQRLRATVRNSDTVARIGGDEFVILIESFDNPNELVHLGRKLIATIGAPTQLSDGVPISVGASVGFALYPRNGSDMSDLLQIADKGMYDCKVSGLMELQ